MEEDDVTEETLQWKQKELALLRAMEAYIHQRQGRESQAQTDYEAALSELKKRYVFVLCFFQVLSVILIAQTGLETPTRV